ncbi:NACHT domain-containing protein [Streptomyces sp. NPDC005538]|uniref:NACHT domain-containing protein n=1 Tax=unclassified Streptomyces TaxID=2593676 RepID=UPI0033AF1205
MAVVSVATVWGLLTGLTLGGVLQPALAVVALSLPAAVWWREYLPHRPRPPAAAEILLRRVRAVESEQLRQLGRPLHPPFSLASARVPLPVPDQTISAMFETLHNQRLVITGGPGTGKTTAARRLVAALLDRRTPGDGPVPVLVSLASWDPASQSVEDWFASRITDRYGVDEAHVRTLIASRRLLPVLDGLDELPPSQRATAVPLLVRWLTGFPGYVLTCRTDAHEEMADLLGSGVGTTVTLLPLRAVDVTDQLREVDARRWEPVTRAIEGDPDGPLAEALSSPWLLSLAASGYDGPHPRDPAELTDRTELSDATAIRQRILDTADPTASIEGWGTAGRRRLELLIDAMGSESDGLLLWWRMAEKYGSVSMRAYVAGALLGIPVLVALTADRGLGDELLVACGALCFLVFAMHPGSQGTPHRFGLWQRWSSMSDRLIRGAFMSLIALAPYSAWDVDPVGLLTSASVTGSTVLVVNVLAGLVLTFTELNTEPGRARRAGDLRTDLRAALLTSGMFTVLTCLPLGLSAAGRLGAGGVTGLPWFIWASFPVGAFATVLLTCTAWGRYHLAHLDLVVSGDLPLRLRRFLDQATEKGLLTPADGYGTGCYAFRHSRVREALVSRGVDGLARFRATERFRNEIRTEVLALPQSVAYLAYTSDGSPETHARETEHIAELADEVLTNQLHAAADKGAEAYERYRTARQRMSDASRIRVWANPTAARFYGLATVAAGDIAFAPLLILSKHGIASQIMVGSMLFGTSLVTYVTIKKRELLPRSLTPAFAAFLRFYMVLGFYIASYWVLPFFVPKHLRNTVALISGAVTVVFLLAWLYARPHVARARAVLDDDPAAWPDLPAIRHHREVAFRSRQTWLTVVARDGVMPLIRAHLRVGTDTGTVPALPAIAPSRLTGSRHTDQFVSSEAADEIAFQLRELESASIGVSGQRGAGKSSLMQRFCTPGPLSAADDLLVLAAAPTSYDPREFLIHLFAEVCRKVTGDDPTDDGRPGPNPLRRRALARHMGGAAVAVAGIVITLGTLFWPELTSAGDAITGHMKNLLMTTGVLLTVTGVAWALFLSVRGGRRIGHLSDIEVTAAAHLRTLHYQLTFMRARNAQLALPGGLQVSDGTQVQHTRQVLSYPELVARFRSFLTEVSRDRGQLGGRVVIGIDELDKLGSPQDAERFLNDLKVVFGIRCCHFLVAVSEDALTTFGRHVLDVRTAFDSAFDRVVAVRPLNLRQARTLLELRGVWLPDPYLWLCQVLSGGLPRDLLRTVTSLATERALRGTADMRQLTRKLIEDDARSVLSAQTRYAATLSGAAAPRTARWIADASQAPVTADEWEAALNNAPAVDPDQYETARAVTQTRAYLALGANLLRTFVEGDVALHLDWLRSAGPAPVDRLTTARAKLATEPEASWSAVIRFRAEVPGLAPLP